MRYKLFSHFFSEIENSPVEAISSLRTNSHKVQLYVKRDDLLHPILSGNKWRKLKHILLNIERLGKQRIVVMGGPYSNLLHALAFICMKVDWQLRMLVRGYPEQPLTPMLLDAKRWGATIEFKDRKSFRQLREKPPQLADDEYWISEGAFHPLALLGTTETFSELSFTPDYIVMATATGSSLAGLSIGAHRQGRKTKIIGISVLNNAQQVTADLEKMLPKNVARPQIVQGYEFGGYAKSNPQLKDFINQFSNAAGIELEPVYNGKSFFATMDLIEKGFFKPGSRVLLIHCGGLQGKRKN